ncbi:hypothetical protein M408DRAFT_258000 [Serendipita vermifera MAFF 305830]|uniref:D-xylose 1-dehydrogenase (NADP(+), D-xylono-1,5-lactone-forming) n=1 Tax=Serendipita vermifera MAFF 305830 TaxID=933852 RepID=A0A0C3BIM2_SERVB|nr:hypothetical protein M408DRAFT_258000 [Serendipita vermifera MAFF 305830]
MTAYLAFTKMVFTLRWGIMATGGIANSFASDLLLEPSARGTEDVQHIIAAVASSSSESKALEFAQKLGVETSAKAYGSYEQLVRDEAVDIIYIATPQSRHYTDVLLALGAGKHVLCEKPFTINAAQATHLTEVAKSKGLFLMEAAWTRFFPHTRQILKTLHEEKQIGRIRGGALLDLGYYPLLWADLILSDHPDNGKAAPKVTAAVSLTPKGVDEFTGITLTYEKLGAVAYLTTSLSAKTQTPYSVHIQGDKGTLMISGTPPNPRGYTLQVDGQDPIEQTATRAGNNLIWQADACARAIRDGQRGCPESPLENTLAIVKIMDEVRRQGKFVFPSPLEDTQR